MLGKIINWCKRISNVLRYHMFPILIVNKWQRPPTWEGRMKRQWRGKESRKKRPIAPLHEFLQLKHVYLYLWTNGCFWRCVLRKCRNSSTPKPLIRNHGFHCHHVVTVRKCTKQVLGAWECLYPANGIINLRSKT